jgi:two-component system, chemotaxis family, response regulator Rcp1
MGRPLRILIVDDYPEDRELTVQQLRRHLIANPLESVETGEDCLTRLRDGSKPHIDLVLLDSRLPRMDGEQVTAAIRQDANLRDVCVVMLTNLAPTRATADGPDAPDAVMEKPLQPAALFRTLRRIGGFEVMVTTRDD